MRGKHSDGLPVADLLAKAREGDRPTHGLRPRSLGDTPTDEIPLVRPHPVTRFGSRTPNP